MTQTPKTPNKDNHSQQIKSIRKDVQDSAREISQSEKMHLPSVDAVNKYNGSANTPIQTAEDFLKDKLESFPDVKGHSFYWEEDVLKALELKEQEIRQECIRECVNCMENNIIVKKAKQQAQQELWDEICRLNEDSETNETLFITLDKPEAAKIKKRFNLK